MISIFTTFKNPFGFSQQASKALTGLGALFFVADVIATETVNQMLNELSEDFEYFLAQAKLKGISAVRTLLQSQGAKMQEYFYLEDICQSIHEKILTGEINTEKKLEEAENIASENYYFYVFKRIDNPNNEGKAIVLDAIFLQE